MLTAALTDQTRLVHLQATCTSHWAVQVAQLGLPLLSWFSWPGGSNSCPVIILVAAVARARGTTKSKQPLLLAVTTENTTGQAAFTKRVVRTEHAIS